MVDALLSAKQLMDSLSVKCRYITKDKNGILTAWTQKPSPYTCDNENVWAINTNCGWSKNVGEIISSILKIKDFENAPWTQCIYERKTSPRDWLGCLCKFYNVPNSEYVYGVLTAYNEGANYPFNCRAAGQNFACAEPVKSEDIKFFE